MKVYDVSYPDDLDTLVVVAESKEKALELFNEKLWHFAQEARVKRPWFKTPVVKLDDIQENSIDEVLWVVERH